MKQRIYKNGRLIKEFTDKQFIDAFGDGITTPSVIAEVVGCGTSLAQKRLKTLYNNNNISGQLIANRWIYWKKEG